jgi:hypothetical protein
MKIRKQNILVFFIFLTLLSQCTDENSGNYNSEEEGTDNESSSCGIEDGSHSATVEYHNPDTGHSATYDLEVEVEECVVTTVYFPRGGWLDDSHISPEELDSDGNVTLEDEKGRTFEVHIDN